MKKLILLVLVTLILTGCTIVRIDTTSIDNIVDVILSKYPKKTLYITVWGEDISIMYQEE